jgi:hypothetical protein
MKLVFEKSGDFLSLGFFHNPLTDKWFESLQEQKATRFCVREQYPMPIQLGKEVLETLHAINAKLPAFHLEPFEISADRILDQRYMEQVHCHWQQLSRQHPRLRQILNQLGVDFDRINRNTHEIEFYDHSLLEFDNLTNTLPLAINSLDYADCFSYDQCHLRIEYANIGRTTFDAWHYDGDLSEIDNFSTIQFNIAMQLIKPHRVLPSPTYIEWCNKNKLQPLPGAIPLGNFSNYTEQLADLRQVVYRNLENDPYVLLQG